MRSNHRPRSAGAGQPKRKPEAAFTLVEVLFAIFIFILMVLMFASVTSATARSSHFGSDYAQAMSLAQHKIDQLQGAGFSNLASQGIATSGTNALADSTGSVSGTMSPQASQTAGSSVTYTFTNTDHMSTTFPGTSSGTIVVTPYPDQAAANMLQATITIKWQGAAHVQSVYTIQTVIPHTASM